MHGFPMSHMGIGMLGPLCLCPLPSMYKINCLGSQHSLFRAISSSTSTAFLLRPTGTIFVLNHKKHVAQMFFTVRKESTGRS